MNDPGIAFRRLIHRHGISQSEIAEKLNLSQASVSAWAARGIPAGRAVELATLIGADIEDLNPAVYYPKARNQPPRSHHALARFTEDQESLKARLLGLIDTARLTDEDIRALTYLTERLKEN